MKNMIRGFLCWLWQRVANINDRLFRRGCDFAGWMSQEEAGFSEDKGNQYQPCSDALYKVLKRYPITEQDSIIDIGCGKGKAMYIMSRFPFKKISGYDLSEQLIDIANQNFAHLGLENCSAFQDDAAEFTGYDDFNYIYLFNSVPEEIFQKAMTQVCESLKRNPRKCTLIYLNPVYHDYLIKNTPFKWTFTRKSWISWFEYGCYEGDC